MVEALPRGSSGRRVLQTLGAINVLVPYLGQRETIRLQLLNRWMRDIGVGRSQHRIFLYHCKAV